MEIRQTQNPGRVEEGGEWKHENILELPNLVIGTNLRPK